MNLDPKTQREPRTEAKTKVNEKTIIQTYLQLINDILYFSYIELVPKVLTKTNYDWHKSKGNIIVVGRGGNGREVLIQADSLPRKYAELAKMLVCGGMEMGEYYLKSKIVNWLPLVPEKDKQAIFEYRIQKQLNDFETGEQSQVDKSGLPMSAIEMYMLEVRWILLMQEGYNRYKKELLTLDIRSKEQFRMLCISVAKSKGVKFGTNMVALRRDKIAKYEKQGIIGIISGKWGNKSAEKVSDECLQTLINLYGDRTKPSTKKVTKAYNNIATAQGWDTVTEQTVFNNLQKPEIKQVWTLGRHGYEVWKRDYQYTASRFRATLPNALWIGDDTKVNLWYYDAKGVKASLQVYAIVDSHSGYWLGRAYAENKEGKSIQAEHVRNAFGDSVVKSGGYMPFQMLYDNDGANNFFERLNTVHFPCMPYNGQSKYIERMFKKVQEGFMADDPAFTGMNIQSKTDQSKRILADATPYSNKEEAIKASEFWFEVMNNTKDERTGLSSKEKYYSTLNEEARKMTDIDAFEILYEWNKDTITMTKNGFRMQHNKRELLYDVLNDNQIDIAFYEENVKREFKIKYNPRDMNKIALYTTDERYIGVAQTKNRLAEAVQDYRPDERMMINEVLLVKKAQKTTVQRKLKIASDVCDADTLLGMGHKHVSKAVLNQAEADMYTGYHEQQIKAEDMVLSIEQEQRARARRQ